MLLMYETHRIKGLHFYEFEAAYRDAYLPALASDGKARLLWFFSVAHGATISFNAVTVTGIPDWEEWERLAQRVQQGDLQSWAHEVDRLRYGAEGRLLRPVAWSPLQEIDLTAVPTTPVTHDLQMYAEDTVRPDAGELDEAVEAIRAALALASGATGEAPLAELTGAFRSTPGGGRRREVVLLQKVLDLERLARFYLSDETPEGPPWSARHGAVPFADTWETRMLRTAEWSPLN
jgi:hypothetical protein